MLLKVILKTTDLVKINSTKSPIILQIDIEIHSYHFPGLITVCDLIQLKMLLAAYFPYRSSQGLHEIHWNTSFIDYKLGSWTNHGCLTGVLLTSPLFLWLWLLLIIGVWSELALARFWKTPFISGVCTSESCSLCWTSLMISA